ncbi:cilia- and flagella-associated protein 418 isoform X3 [Narcine bancroftii]|uniref:cilia- and flagella-associated protein 418 isoform X3 n=1 Tax=Narcine bancroftii TaxID=1343680 RepID=UPI0038312E62
MADDLDRLLDEVEMRFCRSGSTSSLEGEERTGDGEGSSEEVKISSPPIPSDETFKEEDNLNDLIKEIFHDNPTASDLSKSSPSAVTNGAGLKNFSRAKVRKCSPVYLGGSSESYGLGTNTSHRNNMPDLNKLKGKAVRKSGARAYACQCSWSSIQNLTDLRDEQHLRWVCGKH